MSAAEDLARALDVDDTPVSEGFEIDSLDKATWAVRKIAQHRARYAEAQAVAERETRRIELWLGAERHRLVQGTEHLEYLLRRYHEQRITEDNPSATSWAGVKQSKTVHTPAGDLVARKASDTVEVDDTAFVPWAEGHAPSLLNSPKAPTPAKAEIKKLAGLLTLMADGTLVNVETGEFLPGVVLVEGEVTYTVKTPEVDR